MRTTLSIDDDVLAAVKELADKEGVTAGEMLSRLAREALQQPATAAGLVRHGVPVFSAAGEIVTSERVHQLLDEDRP
jgi:predicted transcriptional regulator